MFKEESKELIVRKNNKLVEARYSLTTNETKVFLMLLYRLQSNTEGVLSCDIEHHEFMQVLKSKRDYTVNSISETLSELRRKPIYFEIPTELKKGKKWGEYGFINGFTFDEETRIFNIEASQKIYDIVKSYLEDGYTPNNLAVLFGVRNSYTYRLYDLLRKWSGRKTIINYEVEQLKEWLMLEDKYTAYSDFKKRVITPAVKELNSTEVLKIEIKENKIGRKVNSIDFIVNDLDKRKGFNVITEVETVLYEGGKPIPVLQGCINFDAVEINQEQQEEGIKYPAIPMDFYIPEDVKASVEVKQTLIKYCLDNDINFKDSTYVKALNIALNDIKKKTGSPRLTKGNINLFCKILIDAVEYVFNTLTDLEVFAPVEQEACATLEEPAQTTQESKEGQEISQEAY